jgi:hypothetical protein
MTIERRENWADHYVSFGSSMHQGTSRLGMDCNSGVGTIHRSELLRCSAKALRVVDMAIEFVRLSYTDIRRIRYCHFSPAPLKDLLWAFALA